jgi:hypothetical protein
MSMPGSVSASSEVASQVSTAPMRDGGAPLVSVGAESCHVRLDPLGDPIGARERAS